MSASIGLLVTLPLGWTDSLVVRVRCPFCLWAMENCGPAALHELVVAINSHEPLCHARPR